MKPNPRRSSLRQPKDDPLLPVDSETPPSPESIKFTFHIDHKQTKKGTNKQGKIPKKTG